MTIDPRARERRKAWRAAAIAAMSAAVGSATGLPAAALDVTMGPVTTIVVGDRPGPNARINVIKLLDTFALTGAGVNLGQVEPGRPGDPQIVAPGPPPAAELSHPNVNPGGGAVGVSIVIGGVAQVPAAGAGIRNHPTQVAGVMVSDHPTFQGAAPGARLFSAAAGFVDQRADVVAAEAARAAGGGVRIINYSFGEPLANADFLGGGPAILNGNSLLSLHVDLLAGTRDVLVVVAGNEDIRADNPIAVPADAFNAITVGATTQRGNGAGFRFDQVANFNTSNATADGRTKTDIVAPGGSSIRMTLRNGAVTRDVEVFPVVLAPGEVVTATVNLAPSSDPNMPSLIDTNGDAILDAAVFRRSGGTSFAAPHVAAAAALVRQRQVQEGLFQDHLTTKAVLLNAASKHVLSIDPDGPTLGPLPGEAWPVRQLARNPDPLAITRPLDADIGIGQLNGLAAIRQTQPSDDARGVFVESSTLAAGESRTQRLNGGRLLHAGALVTATLTWDREVRLNAGVDPNVVANLTTVANYAPRPLANLDLELVDHGTGRVVARSSSNSGGDLRTGGDNVEHLYVNVPATGAYDLRIVNRATDQNPTFALAVSAGTSNGPAFSVDGGAFNFRPGIGAPARDGIGVPAPNPAEGRMAPFFGAPYPNDVNALGTAGPGFLPTEGEIFVSSLDGTNIQRLSAALGTRSRVGPHNGPPAAMAVINQGLAAVPMNDRVGTFGLQPDDNVVGLSWGTDGTAGRPGVLLFSVDPFAFGLPGTDVNVEAVLSPPLVGPDPRPFPRNVPGGAPGDEAAGDIFKSRRFDRFGAHPSALMAPAVKLNEQLVDEARLGLQAPRPRGTLLGAQEDDLDALEMDGVLGAVDADGDGLHDAPAFFTLDRWSPSLAGVGCGAAGPDDIFVSRAPFSFATFADGLCDIHLLPFDALDALVLSDIGFPGLLDRGIDEALFSLDSLSTSIAALGASPGDVYYTDFLRPFDPRRDWKAGGSLYAAAAALGLGLFDNLDALDIASTVEPVAEPAALALLLTALGSIAAARGRGRAAT